MSSATAPVVAAVSAPLVVNSATTALQISGSGFASDGKRESAIGSAGRAVHLLVAAPGFNPSGCARPGGISIETNPNLSQGAAGADQSGILRIAL